MKISGSKALVVGGASGMGRATAALLRSKGAAVAIMDLHSKGGDVAEELGAKYYYCDVTDYEEVALAIAAIVEDLGGLGIAVNTAGGALPCRTIGKNGPHSLDEFRRTVELNLIATFNLNRLQAWEMSKEDGEDGERGVIINTASIAAFEGQIGQVAYTAAKAGIAGMSLTMARDLGRNGVRVLAIAPSLFATGLTAGISEAMASALTAGAAFPQRMGIPDEFAHLAVAIVENQMLNGTTIRLDGGQRFAAR